ncbi:T9SS type B sorting domain-containing protein [Flagellimonas pacifica]|uniref:Gliding motility-associated C-terminal domain-containing protein n=1 Tax=Flagellimonas pacifica TaxID=1247520 RepID=A0A285MU97_9FLAO|nr:T9SS type B sorting domain-containing protein [Allomuricauda parva]SNZ00273.1 gliding motility-associated C-terminal domain-containing protein [Allomuricauda parva]
MLYKYICLFLISLFSFALFGQGETSNWYFGNGAGIKFNNDGTVVPLTNGRINTFEGCASLSDAAGNLLLYTDGIRVYDGNHSLMQNGSGLYGDPSSTQSAIIVQKPQDPNIIYIFTVDTSTFEDDPDLGLNYSVVDLSLNGGNGAVILKNVNLLEDCSEKISAVVKNCMDNSIWVVVLGTYSGGVGRFNTYYAYEISPTGVNATPVKSTFNDLQVVDPRGYLKFSADGKTLASANSSNGLYIYDFDANTGVVSNQQILTITAPNKFPYGIEFSPNQQFLYTHTSNNEPANQDGGHSSSLLQFDLTATDISASEVEIDRNPIYRGALQLGQNGKIYRTIAESYIKGTPYLGVIENPNEKGIAANYKHNAISLNGRNATQGLPPFIQSFFDRVEIVKNTDGSTSTSLDICYGEPFNLEVENIPGATYNWEKDGNPITNPSNVLAINTADVTDSGRYSLEITLSDPSECPIIGEAFISVNPLPNAPFLSLVQCDINTNNATDGITFFNLEQAIFDTSYTFSFYESPADITTNSPITDPIGYVNSTPFNQTIQYKVADEMGCENFGELELTVRSVVFTPDDEKSFYQCDDNPEDLLLESTFDLSDFQQVNYPNKDIAFYATLEDASLEQNSISGVYKSISKTIYARIEDSNECEDIDVIHLVVNPTPSFTFDNEILWCTDGPPLPIKAPGGFDFYRWYKNEGGLNQEMGNQQDLQVSSTGNYTLLAGYIYNTNDGSFECTNEVEFEVIPSNIAKIEDERIEDIWENNLIEVIVSGDGDYEYSLDGNNYQDSPEFRNIQPGFPIIYVRDKNGCGIARKKISVIGYPKFFTPNGDNYNDSWQIIGANSLFQAESIISIYNRFGQLVAQISPKTEGWDGTFNNNALPASDYWFRVSLEDGRIFKGHFALKR